jgi:hypothetical protein
MIITLLCEPRSGSTNLANWFYFNKKFTVFFNPDIELKFRNSNNKWYQNGIHPSDYKYQTDNLLIKEDYYHYKNYSDFLGVSDKIICLFRENENEQIESWINAKLTNNWDREWVLKNIKSEEEVTFFKKLKRSFKENYLDKEFFKISYEELYYNNGFQKIVDYINLDCVKNEKFPLGKKYRINLKINKLI